MKYQVYLNKETTEIVESIARATNQKPNTFIKKFIEETLSQAMSIVVKEQKELENGSK